MNPKSANREEFSELVELAKKFPFAQPLHTLLARLAKDLKMDQNQYLNAAAIYSADRNVLKHYVTDESLEDFFGFRTPAIDVDEYNANAATEVADADSKEELAIQAELKENKAKHEVQQHQEHVVHLDKDASGNEIYKEVLENLEKLKKLRKKYDFIEQRIDSEKKTKPEEIGNEDATTQSISDRDMSNADILKEEKEESSHNSIAPAKAEENKIDQQQKIINSFLDKLPQLKRKHAKKASGEKESEQEDLAKDSTTFTDELISENLAIIYIRQGKKDKAVDIYRKLIWKFPQKKAYFASRIEELTQE